MAYWLMKSEPSCFSIDDLENSPNKTTHWDGVRNYQARNMLRDDIKNGDGVLYYHSNCKPPGIVGTAVVVKEGYPDFTAFDSTQKHFDPDSDPDNPRWFMVDIQFKEKFSRMISLEELKMNPKLDGMQLLKKGNRLSVTSISPEHWKIIMNIAGQKR